MFDRVLDKYALQVELIERDIYRQAGVEVSVLRLDRFCPELSGNKFFKLKYNIKAALEEKSSCLLSFGGAYSNHIHALAYAAKVYQLPVIGVIRGEQHNKLNPTLQDAKDWGMKLHFVSRSDYRRRQELGFLHALEEEFGPFFLIPEGGSNEAAQRGCEELGQWLAKHCADIDSFFLPCATGGTMAGIVAGVDAGQQVNGISVLKGADHLQKDIENLLAEKMASPWKIWHQFHCGGYAKFDVALARFIDGFYQDTGLLIEPVYSGKMFFAIEQLLQQGQLPRGSKILAIHTGGLQGLRGMQSRLAAIQAIA